MGFSEDQISAVEGDYRNSDLFTDEEKAAMRWAEVMTDKLYQGKPGSPPQDGPAFENLKKYFNKAQIVEISMVSGFFNFWNRFTDSLKIDIEDNPVMNLFMKSASVDKDDYKAYMQDCWWNDRANKGD